VAAAIGLLRAAQAVYRTDRDWDRLAEQDATASRAPWYAVARIGIAKRTDGWWRWYAALMDDDPVPALSRLRIPLFAAFAGDDELVDSAESMEIIAGLAPGGLQATARRYEGVAHALRDKDRRLAIPAAYWTDLMAFLAPFR